jgi:hypothetical protein
MEQDDGQMLLAPTSCPVAEKLGLIRLGRSPRARTRGR